MTRTRFEKCREYGKTGELASNSRDEQELSVLCLRIAQAALVNTLMIQDLIDDPDIGDILVTAADKRGVTPLFWEHVLPYLDNFRASSRHEGRASHCSAQPAAMMMRCG